MDSLSYIHFYYYTHFSSTLKEIKTCSQALKSTMYHGPQAPYLLWLMGNSACDQLRKSLENHLPANHPPPPCGSHTPLDCISPSPPQLHIPALACSLLSPPHAYPFSFC